MFKFFIWGDKDPYREGLAKSKADGECHSVECQWLWLDRPEPGAQCSSSSWVAGTNLLSHPLLPFMLLCNKETEIDSRAAFDLGCGCAK